MRNKRGFGIYYDPSKATSGQRFFKSLTEQLSLVSLPLSELPAVILFNASTPFLELLKAKLRGQKIVLRIDGLYFDKLSKPFLSSFYTPIRLLFSFGVKYKFTHDFFAFWANLLKENYSGFLKILFADHIIYQSLFSKNMHSRFFKNKKSTIILNGAEFQSSELKNELCKSGNIIKLVTIYDGWRPSKRINELLRFIEWANKIQTEDKIELTILGYDGKPADYFNNKDIEILKNSPFVITVPKFNEFDSTISRNLLASHMYITFSFRDSCPNAVIESMAFGLPVVATTSGGLPDIVRDAGRLVELSDFNDGYFSSHRYECDFPPIDYLEVIRSIKIISKEYLWYRSKVSKRFKEELDIKVVAEKYREVLAGEAFIYSGI